VAQIPYTHVSKCKNDKIKGEKTPKQWQAFNHSAPKAQWDKKERTVEREMP
jgi:hypothetical protein